MTIRPTVDVATYVAGHENRKRLPLSLINFSPQLGIEAVA
jgi:hypothetical protein